MAGEMTEFERLLRVVGEERASHTAQEVSEAEESLRKMAGADDKKTETDLNDASVFCIIFGITFLVFLAAILLTPVLIPHKDHGDVFDNYPMMVAAASFATLGPLLLIGAIGLRARREWARIVMLTSVLVGGLCGVVFAAACLAHGIGRESTSPLSPPKAIGSYFLCFMMAVYSLWLARMFWRYLTSERIRVAFQERKS